MRKGNSGSVFGGEQRRMSPAVRSGFVGLDNLIGGFYPGDVVLVESLTRFGMEAFALNVALSAMRSGTPVLFFSLRLGKDQIEKRLSSLMDPALSDRGNPGRIGAQSVGLPDAGSRPEQADICIFDVPSGLAVSEIWFTAFREIRPGSDRRGIVIVDSLQHIGSSWVGLQEGQDIAAMCSLKAMALKLDVPVLAMSYLDLASRQYWIDRAYSKPEALSSAIRRQIADIGLILEQPRMADEVERGGSDLVGSTNVIVAKRSYRATNEISLLLHPGRSEFATVCAQEPDAPFAGSSDPAQVVLQAVASCRGISVDDFLSPNRSRKIAEPREVAMYLCRECLHMPYASLGEVFNRDHTTAMHACSEVERRMREDDSFRVEVAALKDEIDFLITPI